MPAVFPWPGKRKAVPYSKMARPGRSSWRPSAAAALSLAPPRKGRLDIYNDWTNLTTCSAASRSGPTHCRELGSSPSTADLIPVLPPDRGTPGGTSAFETEPPGSGGHPEADAGRSQGGDVRGPRRLPHLSTASAAGNSWPSELNVEIVQRFPSEPGSSHFLENRDLEDRLPG